MEVAIKKSQRDGNVEAFRCLLMFLIVVYHAFLNSPYAGCKAVWTVCFTTLICWHVDGFLAISGWYGMKFGWPKVIRFVEHMFFYGALSCLYCWVADAPLRNPFSLFFGAWFGASYLALMFIAPVVNWSIKKEVGRINLGAVLVVALGIGLFASWITGRFGARMVPVQNFGFYSVALMVFIYGLVQFLRKVLNGRRPQLRLLIVGVAVFIALMPVCRLIDNIWLSMTGRRFDGIGAYFAAFDAPHTILAAISLLLLFVYYVRLPKWCGDFAVRLSPYLFGVYLCHATTSFGGRFYELENWLVNSLHLHGFFAVLLTAVFIFVVCIGVEMVRKGIVWMFECLNVRNVRMRVG